MTEKKTDTISIRVTPEVRTELQQIATSKRWSVSQTAALIISETLKKESLRERL